MRRWRRRASLVIVIFYYTALAFLALLLPKKKTEFVAEDGIFELLFKKLAWAAFLGIRIAESASVEDVLLDFAALKAKDAWRSLGGKAFENISGHTYVVSLITCLLITTFPKTRHPHTALRLSVCLFYNFYVLLTMVFYHTKHECLLAVECSAAVAICRCCFFKRANQGTRFRTASPETDQRRLQKASIETETTETGCG